MKTGRGIHWGLAVTCFSAGMLTHMGYELLRNGERPARATSPGAAPEKLEGPGKPQAPEKPEAPEKAKPRPESRSEPPRSLEARTGVRSAMEYVQELTLFESQFARATSSEEKAGIQSEAKRFVAANRGSVAQELAANPSLRDRVRKLTEGLGLP